MIKKPVQRADKIKSNPRNCKRQPVTIVQMKLKVTVITFIGTIYTANRL